MAKCFYIKSFGCKVNQCDGDAVARRLTGLGLDRTSDPAMAQLCIVNGCTVTATADSKCFKFVRSLRRANPAAHVAITGCTAVRLAGTSFDRPPVANTVIGYDDAEAWRNLADSLPEPAEPDILPPPGPPPSRTRVFVKVQDGCDAFCSYCIVPHMRGRPNSVPREQVFAEVERAMRHGTQEIVLTGTRLGKYGDDLDGDDSLATLIAELDRRFGIPRIRLSSIELAGLDDRLLDTFARVAALQHHVHIPLQSGDPDVLRSMNRPYGPETFMAMVSRLRDLWPDVGVTTDVIVGFPGESPAAFARTVEFVETARFSRLHVFRFSPRPGTPASSMPARVSSQDVHDRSHEMLGLGARLATEFAGRQVGRAAEVLVEGRRHPELGYLMGLTGNYVAALVPDADDGMVNRIVPVRVRAAEGATLECEIGENSGTGENSRYSSGGTVENSPPVYRWVPEPANHPVL